MPFSYRKWLAGSTGASCRRKKSRKKEIAVQFLCRGISTITFTLCLSTDPQLCRGTPSQGRIEGTQVMEFVSPEKPDKAWGNFLCCAVITPSMLGSKWTPSSPCKSLPGAASAGPEHRDQESPSPQVCPAPGRTPHSGKTLFCNSLLSALALSRPAAIPAAPRSRRSKSWNCDAKICASKKGQQHPR